MKDIDADYYGYRDEDDGILVPLEQDAEKEGQKSIQAHDGGNTKQPHLKEVWHTFKNI